MAVIKVAGEAIILTVLAVLVVGIVGTVNQWDSAIQYSNALFIAGCVVLIGGAASRLGAGQEWSHFQGLYAESFRDRSASERANLIVSASTSVRLVVAGFLSGITLFLMSVFVMNLP